MQNLIKKQNWRNIKMKKFIFDLQNHAEVENVNSEMVNVQVINPAVTVASPQSDIDSMKIAIVQFEAAGAKFFPDELAAMKQKLADMEAEAEAAIKVAETDVKEACAKLVTAEQTFVQKYGQAIAHGLEIILLAYIAGRLAGVI
jgi:hypothetical protein